MANNYVKRRHDIGITVGGTVRGFMLAKDKNGTPVYQTNIDEYLSNQQATGALGYEHLPAEKQFSIVGESHRSGFGEDFYDSSAPERYNSSYGMDLRAKDRAILSWGATAITLPTTTAPTITDAGMEAWDDSNTLTNWTKVGTGTLSQETTNEQAGTYSAELENGGGETLYIYQDLSTTEIKGRRFIVTAYVRSPGRNADHKIGINDGVDTTYGNSLKADNSWTQLTVEKTLSTSATRLRIILENAQASSTLLFDTVTIARPDAGVPTCEATYNGEQYIGIGNILTKLNGTGNGWTGVYEFASPIKSLQVAADGYLYIGLESTKIIDNCEDDWTDGTNGTSDLDTGDFKVGSGSVKITGSSVIAGNILAYEDFATATTFKNFSYYTGFTLWIKSSAAAAANDLALTLGSASGASDVAINLPALTAGVWTKVYARFATPTATGIIDCMSVGLEYNANAADTVIHVDDIRAESSYYYMDTGENFTQSTLDVAPTDSFAREFQPVGLTMWKFLDTNRIYSATDPSNAGGANWSSVTTVDSPDYDILKLLSNGSTLVLKKEDRTFYIDTEGAVQILVEDTRHLSSSTTGKSGVHWQGKYYIPAGTQSLVEYDSGTITWRSPSKYAVSLSDFNGEVQAVTGDEEYLIAIVDNSSKIEVLFGRTEVINGATAWVWHPYQEITLAGCQLAFVSGVYQKRLWIGSTSGGDSMYYIPLPAGYGDLVTDANRSFATNGYFITPKHHANFKGTTKGFTEIEIGLGHTFDTDIYFECHYKKEGDSSWTDAGDLRGTSSNRTPSLYFPADGSSNEPSSTSFQLKFVGKTDDTTKTPVMLWYKIDGVLYPTQRNIISCVVRCADGILDKEGVDSGLTAKEIKSYLESARDATFPVTINDIRGETQTVRFLPTIPFGKVTRAEKILNRETENIEEHYNLEMMVVSVHS